MVICWLVMREAADEASKKERLLESERNANVEQISPTTTAATNAESFTMWGPTSAVASAVANSKKE